MREEKFNIQIEDIYYWSRFSYFANFDEEELGEYKQVKKEYKRISCELLINKKLTDLFSLFI